MDYYQQKKLQDRESHLIGAGISFILVSPIFGIIAGAFLGSSMALYVGTAIVAVMGILGIASGIREKMERKKQEKTQTNTVG